MEITFSGVFIIILVSSRASSVSGLVIIDGTFQVLQQHPQLKKCAESVLHENEYVGCRVSELTGQCHPLTDSWGLKQIIEKGYAYAKKVSVQEKFQPPLTVVSSYDRGVHSWKIPIVLNTGSQIDIFMSIPNWHLNDESDEVFVLQVLNGPDSFAWSRNHWLQLRIMKEKFILIEELIGNGTGITVLGRIEGNRLSALGSPKEKFKMSLLARPNALTVFVSDEEVATLKLTTHIRKMRYIYASKSHRSVDPVFAHGIKFTGVLE